MTNAEIAYTLFRAMTTVSTCMDLMFYLDSCSNAVDALSKTDKVVALLELIRRDIKEAFTSIEALELEKEIEQ